MAGVPLILIAARDEKVIKEIHHIVNKSIHANFTAAITGAVALERAKTREPKLIILDTNYDDMDCLELIDELKKKSITSHIPIMIISEGNISEYDSNKDKYRLIGAFNISDRYKYLAMIKTILK